MSGFSELVLIDKLSKMSNSQQSIQTLSHWIIYHRKRFAQSVQIWDRELYKAPTDKKIAFLYLANDVLQTSRKKGNEFVKEFVKVIKQGTAHVYRSDPTNQKAILRLVDIWEERKVLPDNTIEEMRSALTGKSTPKPTSQPNPTSKNVAPSLPTALLVPHKENPLFDAISQIDELETSKALIEEKIQSLRPELLNGSFKPSNAQPVVVEQHKEVEDAIRTLQQLKSKLTEEQKQRENLIAVLTDVMEKQDGLLNKATASLLDCNTQLEQLEKVKAEMQPLVEQFSKAIVKNTESVDMTYSPSASPRSPTDYVDHTDYPSDVKRQKVSPNNNLPPPLQSGGWPIGGNLNGPPNPFMPPMNFAPPPSLMHTPQNYSQHHADPRVPPPHLPPQNVHRQHVMGPPVHPWGQY